MNKYVIIFCASSLFLSQTTSPKNKKLTLAPNHKAQEQLIISEKWERILNFCVFYTALYCGYQHARKETYTIFPSALWGLLCGVLAEKVANSLFNLFLYDYTPAGALKRKFSSLEAKILNNDLLNPAKSLLLRSDDDAQAYALTYYAGHKQEASARAVNDLQQVIRFCQKFLSLLERYRAYACHNEKYLYAESEMRDKAKKIIFLASKRIQQLKAIKNESATHA